MYMNFKLHIDSSGEFLYNKSRHNILYALGKYTTKKKHIYIEMHTLFLFSFEYKHIHMHIDTFTIFMGQQHHSFCYFVMFVMEPHMVKHIHVAMVNLMIILRYNRTCVLARIRNPN